MTCRATDMPGKLAEWFRQYVLELPLRHNGGGTPTVCFAVLSAPTPVAGL